MTSRIISLFLFFQGGTNQPSGQLIIQVRRLNIFYEKQKASRGTAHARMSTLRSGRYKNALPFYTYVSCSYLKVKLKFTILFFLFAVFPLFHCLQYTSAYV